MLYGFGAVARYAMIVAQSSVCSGRSTYAHDFTSRRPGGIAAGNQLSMISELMVLYDATWSYRILYGATLSTF